MQFENVNAVVVGCGGGLGIAIAQNLAAQGASIAALDFSLELADKAVATLRDAGPGKPFAVQVDVASAPSVARAFQEVDRRFERLDILVNCAGIREVKTIYDLTPEEFERVIAVNLNGTFFCAREAALRMRPTGGGSIVNIASVAGAIGITHRPAYVASKHGVVGLGKNLATDLAKDHIRVNTVGPGTIRTPMTEGYYADESFIAGLNEVVPMGAGGDPGDIADAVSFLCSRQAKFITGAYLPVDGGWLSSKSYSVGGASSVYNSAKNQT
jgi:meso-butanediol dehydrogenase/(S,S)-butanediol dehydrogenase/diacetyl reductase